MNIEDVRDQHNAAVRTASDMLRVVRKLPSDQDIDRNEALNLVSGGHEMQCALDEIDRISQLLLDAAQERQSDD